MVEAIRDYTLAGYTSNAEIAAILARRFHPDITSGDVARWKREQPHFANVVGGALHDLNAIAVSNVRKAIADGSMADTWAFLRLRNPEFMPKAKMELNHNVDTLEERLAKRVDAQAPAVYDPEKEDDGDD